MSYRTEWIGTPIFLGAVLLPLIIPPFALIAVVVLALAAVAAVVAVAGAIVAAPFLLGRHIRRHVVERHQSTQHSVPIATPIAAIAGPTTARRSQ